MPMPSASDNWLSPLNKLRWAKAFKNRATEVTLRDGRVFTLTYKRRKRYGEMADMVWVTGKDWDSPCGWFALEKVLDSEWVGSEEREVTAILTPPIRKRSGDASKI